ncbi:hypothetical protein ZOD2009_08079 [Haladaptatus paucihalophilus DX253]|uniref:Uncharacterized protein n=1 Tax=Haladaptatus paucihalophilus DX253 TaxID=797209 RepID=E7QS43_HALPU|nr:hypothetical protein ZOD2009_08079 [Haladaptatus paucihalophilus DX253]
MRRRPVVRHDRFFTESVPKSFDFSSPVDSGSIPPYRDSTRRGAEQGADDSDEETKHDGVGSVLV